MFEENLKTYKKKNLLKELTLKPQSNESGEYSNFCMKEILTLLKSFTLSSLIRLSLLQSYALS